MRTHFPPDLIELVQITHAILVATDKQDLNICRQFKYYGCPADTVIFSKEWKAHEHELFGPRHIFVRRESVEGGQCGCSGALTSAARCTDVLFVIYHCVERLKSRWHACS